MKDGIIIQARTGSTRLHNKILLPFYGEQRIIDILIANIKIIKLPIRSPMIL